MPATDDTALPALDTCWGFQSGGQAFRATQVVLAVPDTGVDVRLRLQTSDPAVFAQVFAAREYDSPFLPDACATVLDLGANIGLAAVYFAARYPAARIVAVEPDAENFALLLANTAAFGERIIPVQAAVWDTDGVVNLHEHSDDGEHLGHWGRNVSARPSAVQVPALSIPTLMARTGLDHVDVLKVDIEGAEREVFSGDCAWLDSVGLVMVETHDRFRPGSEAAVRRALSAGFEEVAMSGENLVFRRG